MVAGIPGGEATVKTYGRRGTKVVLTPANATMTPMVFAPDEVDLYGKVVTVLRRYVSGDAGVQPGSTSSRVGPYERRRQQLEKDGIDRVQLVPVDPFAGGVGQLGVARARS